VAIPLIRGAYDETREGLRESCADLIANAMDPARASRVRLSFIETLKKFDPLDALVLQARGNAPSPERPSFVADLLAETLSVSVSDVMLFVGNPEFLNCTGIGA
jgi:hypothetical protein